MTRNWRSFAACALVVALSFGAFSAATHGFVAVTSDGLRRARLASAPRELPDIPLVDSTGATLSLRAYAQPGAAVTFVSLVYVRCNSICLTSAGSQSWLQDEILARGMEGRARLLTLSFDPASDTPPVLSAYAKRFAAKPDLWRVATVRETADLKRMLDLFGIVVLPDGRGGYTHNAALFVIGGDGRLEGAYDSDRPDIALANYVHRLGGP
ncbi:MAG TPA: SCO family protein [Burkholderiales bacterium]